MGGQERFIQALCFVMSYMQMCTPLAYFVHLQENLLRIG